MCNSNISTFELTDHIIHKIALSTPFPVGPVNIYLIRHEDSLILVDTGINSLSAQAEFTESLDNLECNVNQIQEIHLTHHHVDHCGLAAWVHKQSGAKIFGHPDIAQYMLQAHTHNEEHHTYYINLMKCLGVPDDRAVQAMTLWNQFKSYTEPFHIDESYSEGCVSSLFLPVFVPGHSATDTLLVFQTTNDSIKEAFVGDHILSETNPNPLMRRPLPGKKPIKALVEYRRSLEKSTKLGLTRCFPGHGPVFCSPDNVIGGILNKQEQRNQRIVNLMKTQDNITPFQLCNHLFPRLDIANLYLGLSVCLGHLDLLVSTGNLSMNKIDNIQYYTLAGD